MRRGLLAAALLLTGCANGLVTPELQGRYLWQADFFDFGGLSGIEVTADGNRFLAVTDQGTAFGGAFVRVDGVITEMVTDTRFRLRDNRGNYVVYPRQDAEGLAIGPDGTVAVSLEGIHRIYLYDDLSEVAVAAIADPDFRGFSGNASLEAVAIGPDGAVYTMPERSGRAERPFPVYRYLNGAWDQPFAIPRRGAFVVVGADVGPDDRLYVLERDFTGIGFRTRVRRFDLAGGGEETLLKTANATHDNLEGISVWRDDAGRLVMTLVSDDNFKALQQTEVVEYRIDDTAPAG